MKPTFNATTGTKECFLHFIVDAAPHVDILRRFFEAMLGATVLFQASALSIPARRAQCLKTSSNKLPLWSLYII